ncbi:uncharacterized protein LAESUDRAFT_716930 [Laetiporus sulphureus 93-53]|uniref:Uncharacterized protein n=1 Tax=Laetiporus sulphureus 93-53 TaxID=1314785 RepID=A0A165C784_9APHY|nr:uncharacterized protein LAESUDRAFT_716930 [Laetiporus sulphureus 93-53]KZT02322.1 hypothetical protein LAESUDRAFT_716930 [Laetiporus sulphureus 93-53]
MAPLTIQIKGQLYWKLVFDYDNGSNTVIINQSYNFATREAYKSSSFREEVSKVAHTEDTTNGASVKAGASYGPISAKVSSNVDIREEINRTLENAIISEGDHEIETIIKEFNREYKVGPHSRLVLYQQNFSAPGISVSGDVFKTTPILLSESERFKEIVITVEVKAVEFIKCLNVVCSDTPGGAPIDRVREIHGGKTDINAGFEGQYVSLVPEYTTSVDDACTSFDIIIHERSMPGYRDLAGGADGDFRHAVPVKNICENMKITGIKLWRSSDSVNYDQVEDEGFNGMSTNINEGRKGDWLYLVWKKVPVYPASLYK